MSVLCQIQSYQDTTPYFRIVSKGAPEILKKYMTDVPADYDDIYLPFVKDGKRVLALAWKEVATMD